MFPKVSRYNGKSDIKGVDIAKFKMHFQLCYEMYGYINK